MNKNKIKALFLGHCVTDEVIDYFEKNMPNVEIFRLASGKEFSLDLTPLMQRQK